MGTSRWIRGAGILVAILCCASLAVAQDTFTLTGANPGGYTNGDVYVSPYTATITNSTGDEIYSGDVICDDFFDDVSVGEDWIVTPSPASSVSPDGLFTGSVTWPDTPLGTTYTNQQAYDAVAWLAVQLLSLPPSSPNLSAEEGAYSFAIWTIFDPSAISSYVPTGTYTVAYVDSLITEAFAANYSGAGVTVWTPVPNEGPGNGGPQEFLTVSTPEASLPATLAVTLGTLVGVIFLLRRRLVRV